MFGLFKKKKPKNQRTCYKCGNTFEHPTPYRLKEGVLCPQCASPIHEFNEVVVPALGGEALCSGIVSIKDIEWDKLPEQTAYWKSRQGRTLTSMQCAGLPIPKDEFVDAALDDKGIRLVDDLINFEAYLPYDRILSVTYGSKHTTSVKELDNDPSLKAAFGGLLFGPVGAIVGAVDPGPKKTIYYYTSHVEIHYKDKKGDNKKLVLYSAVSTEFPITQTGRQEVANFVNKYRELSGVNHKKPKPYVL